MRLIDADKLREKIKLALKVSEEKYNSNLCSDILDEFDDGYWVGRSKAYEAMLEMLEDEEDKTGVEQIKKMPTVDAVAVVRCKDCMYRYDVDECPMLFVRWEDCEDDGDEWVVIEHNEGEGFCHKGKRCEERKKKRTLKSLKISKR